MRLDLAFQAGLQRPDGPVLILYPDTDFDLSPLSDVQIVHSFKPTFDFWNTRFLTQASTPEAKFEIAVVCCTRSKQQTRDLIAQAAKRADIVVVDGQKTSGIDSHYKALRNRCNVTGTITKAHGRLFWFQSADLDDWQSEQHHFYGFMTKPGVFSADGIDPASALLAANLPEHLKGAVADFGAGWGYLSAQILQRDAVVSLDCVEADGIALNCAKTNLQDTRVNFCWDDATKWKGSYDTIVMNPPFHTGRKGDPDLGRAFIQNAAKCLKQKGELWMVANRHLPYEDVLNQCFGHVAELPGDGRFKLFHASRPRRN